MAECQNPDCVREATHNWQNTMLCQDCYEKERQSYNRILDSIRDLYD